MEEGPALGGSSRVFRNLFFDRESVPEPEPEPDPEPELDPEFEPAVGLAAAWSSIGVAVSTAADCTIVTCPFFTMLVQ